MATITTITVPFTYQVPAPAVSCCPNCGKPAPASELSFDGECWDCVVEMHKEMAATREPFDLGGEDNEQPADDVDSPATLGLAGYWG